MADEINERGGNGKDKRRHLSKAKHLVFQYFFLCMFYFLVNQHFVVDGVV
jgi:hypothetical protein